MNRILTVSTAAFTLMFAVWLMFGVLGIPIRQEFGLSEIQFIGWRFFQTNFETFRSEPRLPLIDT